MLMQCVRCGHTNPGATGAPDDACPQCGPIYSKARAPSKSRQALPTYVETMRAQTLYPTFRAVAGLAHWVTWALSVLLLVVSGVLAFFGQFQPALLGLVVAVLTWLVSRAAREGMVMLADLSDAMVRLAASRDG